MYFEVGFLNTDWFVNILNYTVTYITLMIDWTRGLGHTYLELAVLPLSLFLLSTTIGFGLS